MLNRITTEPPTGRGAPCIMLSKVTGAQECDAPNQMHKANSGLKTRDDASCTAVD